jgi:CRISPR-associated endonuclease/helicase Cas3
MPGQFPPYLAHVRQNEHGEPELHEVDEHSRGVARRAAVFASAFGSGEWARLAGLWHDLGKYHPEFQGYIRRATGFDPEAHIETAPGRVDHSTLGAVHALDRLGVAGRILAYIIAGHHAGLPDWNSAEQGSAALLPRVEKNRQRLAAALAETIPSDIASPRSSPTRPLGDSPAFWIRMLFSCLVDADFLDTEEFMNRDRAALRGAYPEVSVLRTRFDRFMAEKAAAVAAAGPLSVVNQARAEVLRQCRDKASLPPGLFSLTVPTGGGKTLSSMAFALAHAAAHEKRRIIYVIPYTSIIEQTADVFREAFRDPETVCDEPPFIEHHSSLEPETETTASRLAAENWDAPLIVTTAVQFFESLFAARTSRCRKLHNIANSVVVLDEAQLLPPHFLTPILATISDLAAHYGVSIVLCTATQPALEEQKTLDSHFPGLSGVREIIDRPEELHTTLKRVQVEVPRDLLTPTSWEDLAQELVQHPSVLCIVSRRDDARDLFRLLPEGSAIHLSALMCGEHRSRVIQRIKESLRAGEPVRVISTQLVEAGVDLDFPVVYRALAGLDSIAQAAGRCNREGRLRSADGEPIMGRVVVFVPPRPAPRGLLRQAAESGRQSLASAGADPIAPARFRDYFLDLYWKQGANLDKHRILEDLKHTGDLQFRFRTAAEKFRLIDDVQVPVIVRYENEALLRDLRFQPDNRYLRRRLQRFTVSIPRYLRQRLAAEGRIEEVHPGIFVLTSELHYHPALGLLTDEDALYEPADLVG